MVSMSPEHWDLLADLHRGGLYRQEFQAAWQNGVAFLAATDGLRGRLPLVVEWRGGQRQPGDEPVPADLRIDHVFLVSCKYLSSIVSNTSPTSLFDRLLAGGHGGRSPDWFAEVAPAAYDELYQAVRDHLRLASGAAEHDLPSSVLDLSTSERALVQRHLGPGQWASRLRPAAAAFAQAVAEASATRWHAALAGADVERALWRLLRIGSTPYFVLGAARHGSLRLRIGTAWDWRQHFKIDDFSVVPAARAQPAVDWHVVVGHRRSTQQATIDGHVEIRWSHGKFAQPPEAKVYLDTPHHRIPGYWALR
ncbi:MAG: hypothetical protein ACRD2C_08135 [Acidimicrobiales bacterium]